MTNNSKNTNVRFDFCEELKYREMAKSHKKTSKILEASIEVGSYVDKIYQGQISRFPGL